MRFWPHLRRILYEYVWEPLYVGSKGSWLNYARCVWYVWFGFLCLYTIRAYCYSEPLSDIDFAQGTGLVSFVAILCAVGSQKRPWRLHWLMLVLCCVQFIAVQRPASYTPHGRFLRSFASIKNGMTTREVVSVMQDSTVAGLTEYHNIHLPVGSVAARQRWFHPGYTGSVQFDHEDPCAGGFYSAYFHKGYVTSTYCYND